MSPLADTISSSSLAKPLPAPPAGSHTKPLLKPEINFSSEVDSLDPSTEQSFWVLAEVSAEVSLDKTFLRPLDVVVILDASAYASRYCIGLACHQLTHLARLLSTQDRLGVLCTLQCDTSSGGIGTGCTVRSLSPPEISAIESDLRRVFKQRELINAKNASVAEVLTTAFRMLEDASSKRNLLNLRQNEPRPMSPIKVKKKFRCANGQVIVLSPYPSELCVPPESDTPFLVHVFHPGIIPSQKNKADSYEWMVSTSCLDNEGSFPTRDLMSLLNYARCHPNPGSITRLCIEIEQCDGIAVEKVLGNKAHNSLRPGQSASLAVRIRVLPKTANTGATQRISSAEKNDKLMHELECMLGVRSQEMFKIKIHYRSSCPQVTTMCSSEQTCTIQKHDPLSNWLPCSLTEIEQHRHKARNSVYQKMMRVAVQERELRNGRGSIEAHSTVSGLLDEVSTFSEAMRTELEYHDILEERCHIPFQQEQFSNENAEKMPLPWPEIGNMDSSASPSDRAETPDDSTSSDATTIHRRSEEENTNDDKARSIWKLIRRHSTSKRSLFARNYTSPQNTPSDAQLEHICGQALRNKRSIGADTLRSISLDTAQRRYGCQTPWL